MFYIIFRCRTEGQNSLGTSPEGSSGDVSLPLKCREERQRLSHTPESQ